MLAQGALRFKLQSEGPGPLEFPLSLDLVPGLLQCGSMQEAEPCIFRRSAQHDLELGCHLGPATRVDEGRDEVRPDFRPFRVLFDQPPIDRYLLPGFSRCSGGRREANSSLEVVGPRLEHLVENLLRVGGQPQCQKGSRDPVSGRCKLRLQFQSLAEKSERQRRDPPVEPGPGPYHNLVELTSARQLAGTGTFRDGAGFLAEIASEIEPDHELVESRTVHDRGPLCGQLRRESERKPARGEDHESRRSVLHLAKQTLDDRERNLGGVLEESVEEIICRFEQKTFWRGAHRVGVLAEGFGQLSDEFAERRSRHGSGHVPRLNILSRRGADVEFERLAKWLPRIEQEIARSYSEARRSAGSTPVADALAVLQEFTLRGGKRLRALLVLAGFHVATGLEPGPALSAAAGIEHFQSWMLIHDDIIDHAEERRGGSSVHRLLATQHGDERLLGSSADYGVGMGITLGDLQEPFTVDAILRSQVPGPRRLQAMNEYVRMTRETAYGQLLDVRNGALPIDRVREEDVMEVHRRKTAEYTVAGPLRLGAMLGGAPPKLLADLESIGTDLGVAFQLRDDVLGAGLAEADIGKSANDLIEGKRTLLVVSAWARADPVGRALLQEVLGNPAAAPARVRAAQELIRSTGSLEYSEHKISELSARAFERIRKSTSLRPGAKKLLEQVGDKLVHRTM